jgi:hypothetical protein
MARHNGVDPEHFIGLMKGNSLLVCSIKKRLSQDLKQPLFCNMFVRRVI